MRNPIRQHIAAIVLDVGVMFFLCHSEISLRNPICQHIAAIVVDVGITLGAIAEFAYGIVLASMWRQLLMMRPRVPIGCTRHNTCWTLPGSQGGLTCSGAPPPSLYIALQLSCPVSFWSLGARVLWVLVTRVCVSSLV